MHAGKALMARRTDATAEAELRPDQVEWVYSPWLVADWIYSRSARRTRTMMIARDVYTIDDTYVIGPSTVLEGVRPLSFPDIHSNQAEGRWEEGRWIGSSVRALHSRLCYE